MIDISVARRDTPAVERLIHFNNAGSALMPAPVYNAFVGHVERERDIGGYEAAAEAAAELDRFYEATATLLGARRDEIAFLESATRAWNAAFHALRWREGDRVVTSQAEYASNYIAFLQARQRFGIEIDLVPDDPAGEIDLAALEAALNRPGVRLVSLTHVPTSGGLVNPAAEVGRLARAAGVLYLLDACQSAGQLPLDVDALGCDFLSATGRKYLRAPRGTGFLYVRRSVLDQLDPPFLDLHGAEWTSADGYEMAADATRFENFEGNIAGKRALGVAIDYALGLGLDAIEQRVGDLANRLRDGLGGLRGVTVHDTGRHRCGIVTFTKADRDPTSLQTALRERSINISVSRRASTLLDMSARGLDRIARASVHYYNTEDEVDRAVAAIDAL